MFAEQRHPGNPCRDDGEWEQCCFTNFGLYNYLRHLRSIFDGFTGVIYCELPKFMDTEFFDYFVAVSLIVGVFA